MADHPTHRTTTTRPSDPVARDEVTEALARIGSAALRRVYGDALALADELAQIESIYGTGCAAFVRQRLGADDLPRWRECVADAVREWSIANGSNVTQIQLAS